MTEKCAYEWESGSRCGAYPMKGSRLCFLHNPKTRTKAALARKKAAATQIIEIGEGVKDLGWPKQIHLRRPRDVRRFVSRLMNEVRAGKVDVPVANSLFVGANVLLKTFDSEAIERVEALEKAVSGQDQRS